MKKTILDLLARSLIATVLATAPLAYADSNPFSEKGTPLPNLLAAAEAPENTQQEPNEETQGDSAPQNQETDNGEYPNPNTKQQESPQEETGDKPENIPQNNAGDN